MQNSRPSLIDRNNFVKECRQRYRVGLWQCPQFLFLLMGFTTSSAMIVTYLVGINYVEPEVIVFIVMGGSSTPLT